MTKFASVACHFDKHATYLEGPKAFKTMMTVDPSGRTVVDLFENILNTDGWKQSKDIKKLADHTFKKISKICDNDKKSHGHKDKKRKIEDQNLSTLDDIQKARFKQLSSIYEGKKPKHNDDVRSFSKAEQLKADEDYAKAIAASYDSADFDRARNLSLASVRPASNSSSSSGSSSSSSAASSSSSSSVSSSSSPVPSVNVDGNNVVSALRAFASAAANVANALQQQNDEPVDAQPVVVAQPTANIHPASMIAAVVAGPVAEDLTFGS